MREREREKEIRALATIKANEDLNQHHPVEMEICVKFFTCRERITMAP
jgi:hypothetical protein